MELARRYVAAMAHLRDRARTRPAALPGALLALILAGAGCTAAPGQPATGASPSATPGRTDPTPSTTPTPSATPTGSPTASATPSIRPASGPLIKRTSLSLHVPQGFGEPEKHARYTGSITGDSCTDIVVYEFTSRAVSLQQLVREEQGSDDWNHKPKRLVDATIAGTKWFHLRGVTHWSKEFSQIDADLYGTYRKGMVVDLEFSRDRVNGCGMPAADRLAEIATVLATVRWR